MTALKFLDPSYVRIVSISPEEAYETCQRLGTGLSKLEAGAIRTHYENLGREPTEIELQTFGQTWSEHCFHKVFKSEIEVAGRIPSRLFKDYIAKATEEIAAPWVISAFSDNAGIIKFDRNHSIAVKVETHNHPSAVEPFGGAATGVGGVIRDILGVFAKPIANTDILCFGPLDCPFEKLPPGTKHSRYLMSGVVAGVASYGNKMGIPTVNGAVYFHESYTGYALVFCGCVGLLKNNEYAARAKPGDILILAGGRTGRDGIHGVSFASDSLGEDADSRRAAVQIPDPIIEEKLSRAILEIAKRKLASAVTDLGGGGLSSSVCEMAKRFDCGAEVELGNVTLRAPDLAPWENWISESQERMLLSVPKDNVSEVLAIFGHEEVVATRLGQLIPERHIILRMGGAQIGSIDVLFLFRPPLPRLHASAVANRWASDRKRSVPAPSRRDLEDDLLSLLRSPNIASKEEIVRRYDHEVGGRTVIKPLHHPRAGPNDASVVKPLRESERGIAISCGLRPALKDAYSMAASSIDEAIRNNVCVGGRRIALLDNFAWGDPNDGVSLRSLVSSAEACYDYAKAFGTPFISGKDSLYNATPIGQITPTLVITAVGIVPKVRNAVSADFKQAGNPIYLLGDTCGGLEYSEYSVMKRLDEGEEEVNRAPLDARKASKMYRAVTNAIDGRMVRACHDVSEGGIGVALAEMCFANSLGARIKLRVSQPPVEFLFSESDSRILVEVDGRKEDSFLKIMNGLPCAKLGVVARHGIQIRSRSGTKLIDLSTDLCYEAWRSTFR
jgi:phosphoribosylformylglycinamidine synthase II